MFNNLIESKPKKQRTTGRLVVSVVAHTMLITAAVYATIQAKESLEKPKQANSEGEVLEQFGVDTTGRAEMNTFKVLKSSDDGFPQSVKNPLPSVRFYPAEIGGRKVKQMVQQPFTFALTK